MLDEAKILARANELYAKEKVSKHGHGFADIPIQSDSIKCVLKALVEALNAKVQY